MSWQVMSFLILGGALTLAFAWYERSRPPARVLALVAALAALAVVGRLAFAPFPNVKPTTDIVLFAGYALGGAPGFAVGAVTALVSNIFLSHGPWTPWQMAAWGGVGMAGGALGAVVRARGSPRRRSAGAAAASPRESRELGRWGLALACGLAGLGFGIVMDLYLWTLAAERTFASYVVIAGRSLPFNVAHVAGNVAFALLIGPPLVRALRRYRRRFEVRWAAPRGSATAARVAASVALVAFAFGGAVVLATPAQAASASERAAQYVAGSQNTDGGFGSSRGRSSAQSYTAEAAFGLAAARRNPQDVTRRERSVIDYVRGGAGGLTSTSEIERTVLLARAAGLSPRRFADRNLHAELEGRQDANGSFDGGVAFTAFGVLALRAAGERTSSPSVQRAAEWLAGRQNTDGGFSLARNGQSDTDLTGAALQAFAAAGDADGEAADRAVAYLRDRAQCKQVDDRSACAGSPGGFGQTLASSPNAQSTAYAVQGLVAAGASSGRTVGAALEYLRSLQAPDGSIRFSRTRDQTPVWVTSQALVALNRKAFPLKPPPRRTRSTRSARPAGKDVEQGGPGQDKKPGRPPSDDDRSRRRSEGSGTAGTGGSGPGTGTSAGSGSGRGTKGATAIPVRPSSAGASTPPGLPPDFALPKTAANALARPGGALAAPTADPLGSPGQLFSDARGAPLAPVASRGPNPPERGSPGQRIGASLALVVLVAGGLILATGGGARARRLWAAARRRTT